MPIFIFPHYKSKATVSYHSNQSSYPIGTKNNSLPLPIDAICEIWQESVSWLQRRYRLKNVDDDDDGRATDACLYYKLTHEEMRTLTSK